MTPAARIAAAITLLDDWLAGQPLEQALTTWGRHNRYAGSGDRAAIRDHVFDAVRRRRSFAALGGAETGRGLMIGALRAAGVDPVTMFTGEGHAPPPLSPDETGPPRAMSRGEALDCPDWLLPEFEASLGADTDAVLRALQARAPVFLRVNLARIDRPRAASALEAEGIVTRPHELAETALEVTEGARRVQHSAPFRDGLVELQDAASQAVVAALPLRANDRVLDYCAGGGGKTLAMAARLPLTLFAHDADPRRMRDLPARATRAGVRVTLLAPGEGSRAAPCDLVLLDVPCSGSGSWRRSPEAKWTLTPERLADLCRIQAQILSEASALVRPGGYLAYATCSLFERENAAQIAAFLARQHGWQQRHARLFTPRDGGDGFFVAILQRQNTIQG
ncbi:RsmB/NOP family class I SAM-dependent RNA methyltransferase [Plastorhodobacter daqingensis]|uniref:RsmB/NOP family class I SAM-dependent RNA methyltransferase n=1 Tax=Plastorhodobacter daqingensis TaxID=1387281 RepID=A0ABW2UMG7_9RHOB